MKQIICIGSACKDIFFPTGEGQIINTPEDLMAQKKISFELGAKYKIENRYESLGGCAANVAAGLSRLGIDVSCYSRIGDDHIANWILEELGRNKVNTDLITREPNCPSDMSAIVIDKESGERVIFSNQKANGNLEIIPEEIKDTGWLFVGDLHGDWESDLDVVFKVAKENDIRVAYNPRQSNIHDNVKKVIDVIPNCEVLFLNKDESIEVLSGTSQNYSEEELNNEEFLLRELNKLGAHVVAITDGVRGAWATDGEDMVHTPGVVVAAKDSTGAGDSFASAFLAAYIKGKGLEECVRWGIANSSSGVQHYGAIEGLLDEKRILAKITHL